jgi:hypothetical protein
MLGGIWLLPPLLLLLLKVWLGAEQGGCLLLQLGQVGATYMVASKQWQPHTSTQNIQHWSTGDAQHGRQHDLAVLTAAARAGATQGPNNVLGFDGVLPPCFQAFSVSVVTAMAYEHVFGLPYKGGSARGPHAWLNETSGTVSASRSQA